MEIAPSFARVATDHDHLLIVNSFSKTYNMTGWRLGYALGSDRLIALMSKVGTLVMCSPPAMIQQAGIAALREGEPFIRELREQYRKRREVVVQALLSIPGISLPLPEGAFYTFPQIEGLQDSMKFVLELLRETRVGIGPGSAFGIHGEGYVRISFASSESVLLPALERFSDHMRDRQTRRHSGRP
jgi:aspartate/methionine/tyrosine aminotransferase